VDTERLLKLLDEPADVNDKPGAPDLVVTDGEIEFRELDSRSGIYLWSY
jgi:ATP-binding cassette subfamily B (MDR/TAP) protein 6